MAQSTPAYPTVLTPAQATSDLASGPSQLRQINAPFPLGDATISTLNTPDPNEARPRKRRRANATSSGDRNKKKARTSVIATTSTSAPPVTSSIVGVGPCSDTQTLTVVSNPTYAAIEKLIGQVKAKADRSVTALDVWYFVKPMDSADEPSQMEAAPTHNIHIPLITQKPTNSYLGCRLCP
jgi:hypothetical protein